MNVKERVAYVRGLIEGSEFHGRDERAVAIWSNVLSILDSLADAIEGLRGSVDDIEEYLEAVDADLADLEEVFGQESLLVEIECNHCGERFSVEEGFLGDEHVEIICPACGRVVDTEESEGEPITFVPAGAAKTDE